INLLIALPIYNLFILNSITLLFSAYVFSEKGSYCICKCEERHASRIEINFEPQVPPLHQPHTSKDPAHFSSLMKCQTYSHSKSRFLKRNSLSSSKSSPS